MRLVNALLDLLEELLGDGAQLLGFFQFVEPDECLEIQLSNVGRIVIVDLYDLDDGHLKDSKDHKAAEFDKDGEDIL